MNIHEYQAKNLLKQFRINVPKGKIAYTSAEAEKVAKKISFQGPWVLKAQIQAGARAKGHFISPKCSKMSGIHITNSLSHIAPVAKKMLGATLVTPQTDAKGKVVHKIYIEEKITTRKTFYLSLVINRIDACLSLLLANTTDNIVDLAQKNPKTIFRLNLNTKTKIKKADMRKASTFLGLPESYLTSFSKMVCNLHRAFIQTDATMIELNPVGINTKNKFVALDAKISIDDHALYRHPNILALRDDNEIDENVLKATQNGFRYQDFKEGRIGLVVNGDGLALSMCDILRRYNEYPACYLNIKGATDSEKIAQGFKLIMNNPRVEGILINILGGFLRCDIAADGIVSAISEIGLNIPLIARFEGTNKKIAENIFHQNAFELLTAQSIEEATKKLSDLIKEND